MSINFVFAESVDDYLDLGVDNAHRVGAHREGEAFNSMDQFSFALNDKITAITFYMAKNHNHINGIEIEYKGNNVFQVGSTNGNKVRKVLGFDEYIDSIKFFAKGTNNSSEEYLNDASTCRHDKAKVTKARFTTNKNNQLWFGKQRGSNCAKSRDINDRVLVGLHGSYENGKILSLGPVWMRQVALSSVNLDVDYDNKTITSYVNTHDDVTSVLINGDDIETTNTQVVSYAMTESAESFWETSSQVTQSLALSVGIEATYGAVTGSIQFDYSQASTESNTNGTDMSVEKTYTTSRERETTIPPRSMIVVTYNSLMQEVSYPYTAIFEDLNNCDESGCARIEIHGELTEITEIDSFRDYHTVGTIDHYEMEIDADLGAMFRDEIEEELSHYMYSYVYVDADGNEVDLDDVE